MIQQRLAVMPMVEINKVEAVVWKLCRCVTRREAVKSHAITEAAESANRLRVIVVMSGLSHVVPIHITRFVYRLTPRINAMEPFATPVSQQMN